MTKSESLHKILSMRFGNMDMLYNHSLNIFLNICNIFFSTGLNLVDV